MEATEIRKLALLEDTHWWYRERRIMLDRALRRLEAAGQGPGWALDVGAAGGGNTRVLRSRGWSSLALEYSVDGASVAAERGLEVIRADARFLPLVSCGMDLVVAFDILEHIEDDYLAAAEIHRVLRPGGTALIAVPCDMRLWSAHDVAVGHVRRYTRETLTDLTEKAGLMTDELCSWNVLMRPVADFRRRRATGSDLATVPRPINAALSAVIALERYLPVKSLPGVSLMMRSHRPS